MPSYTDKIERIALTYAKYPAYIGTLLLDVNNKINGLLKSKNLREVGKLISVSRFYKKLHNN